MTKPLTIAGCYNAMPAINPPYPINIAAIFAHDHRKTAGDIEVGVYIPEIMPRDIVDFYRGFRDFQEVAAFITALKKELKWPVKITNHEKQLAQFVS